MNLLELLDSVGGKQSLGSLAGSLGLESTKTDDLVGALAPVLMAAVQKQTTTEGGLTNFKSALQSGGHQQYLSNPELMASEETRSDGNNILGHLLGSKDVSRNVAAQASASTGVDVSLVKKALPFIASLAMGALSKSTNTGNSLNNDSAGDLLGGLLGGNLDVDDILDVAKKFF